MTAGTLSRPPPRGLLRMLLRLPVVLYRLHLGWLLARRFLLLIHTGRRSGRERATVLEVVTYDPGTGRCVIASAWGEQAQWYRNVMAKPVVRYIIGICERTGRVRRLPALEAERELRDYGRRHPAALRQLAKMMLGEPFQGSDGQFDTLAHGLPVLEIRPSRNEPA